MDHILSFSIGIEDDKIIELVEQNASKQIINDLKLEVFNRIMESPNYYRKPVSVVRGEVVVDDGARLDDWVQNMVKSVLEENKEEIIKRAVDKIAVSYMRSKSFRELVGEK